MKKWLCVLLAVVFLVSTACCAELAWATQSVPLTTEEKLERMIPVLDSLARSIKTDDENTSPYTSLTSEFLWSQLYYLGANWSEVNELISKSSEQISIPAAVMLDYAQASFYGLEQLPEIPDSLAGLIRYDEAAAAYVLMPYDEQEISPVSTNDLFEETYIVLERYATDAAGDLVVGFGLYTKQDNARAAGFTAVMGENTVLNFFEDEAPMFPYSVKDAHVETETDFAGLQTTACSILYVAQQAEAVPTPHSGRDRIRAEIF